MDTISSRDAKNSFGRLLTDVQRGPVQIERHGNPIAVMLSSEEYSRLEEMEDAFWLWRAAKAEEEGYLGATESHELLQELLGAESHSH